MSRYREPRGDEGQDRESYSDDQDRESYEVLPEVYVYLVQPVDEHRANVTEVEGPFTDRDQAGAARTGWAVSQPRRTGFYAVMTADEAAEEQGTTP